MVLWSAKKFFSAYTLEHKGTGAFYDNVQLIAGFQHVEESRHDRQFRDNFRNNRQEKVRVYSLNADFEKEAVKHEFRYGLEGIYNTVHSSAFKLDIASGVMAPLDTRYPNGGSAMQAAAGYITHAYEATPQLIFHDGLRYSQVTLQASFLDKTFFPFPYDQVKQNNGALNGNLGLTILPGVAAGRPCLQWFPGPQRRRFK